MSSEDILSLKDQFKMLGDNDTLMSELDTQLLFVKLKEVGLRIQICSWTMRWTGSNCQLFQIKKRDLTYFYIRFGLNLVFNTTCNQAVSLLNSLNSLLAFLKINKELAHGTYNLHIAYDFMFIYDLLINEYFLVAINNINLYFGSISVAI